MSEFDDDDDYEVAGQLQYHHQQQHSYASSAPQSQTLDLTLDSSDDDDNNNNDNDDDQATETVSFEEELQLALAASVASLQPARPATVSSSVAAALDPRSLWSDLFDPSSTSTSVPASRAASAVAPPPAKKARTATAKPASAAAATTSTSAAKAVKLAEKEAEKARKAAEKAEKAAKREADKAAKKAQREANQRKSRPEMMAEMSVCFDTRIVEQGNGGVILAQMQAEQIACRVRTLAIAGAIEYYRGAAAVREASVVVRIMGDEFVARCRAATIGGLLRDVKLAYGAAVQLVLLIEGLEAAVTSDEQRRARGALVAQFDRLGEIVELEMSGVVVHEARTSQLAADYVVNFTRILAERPYRKAPAFTEFCAESIGKGGALKGLSVWGKQLCQIAGLSAPVAEAIVARYPTFRSLVVDGYLSPLLRDDEKQALLAGIQVQRTAANGSTTLRSIGPVLSTRVFKVFTTADGNHVLQC
jgi:hypothetical protein